MGLRGKLIAKTEVKCGGELFHDHFSSKPHHIPNISPDKVHNFDIHEGELGTVGSVVSWKFTLDGKERVLKQIIDAIDEEKQKITFKFIEGDLLEMYKAFSATLAAEGKWIEWTFEYEKQNEDIPEPLTLLGLAIDLIKDIDSHHHNK
ncbi:kirola [Nicotiana tabacum]|uniref:Kirola n=1 Tax=Nicotiana tabacum TaxID=4097 RepID=A0A1S4BAZ9_TOBAC|nr:PREDICTED: kirola-like [Nicotiana tabacum]